MWQELVNEVGMIWIFLVLVFTAGIVAFAGVLWWLLSGVAGSIVHRLTGLRQDIETLPSCRMENLKQVQVIVGDRGGPDMKLALDQIADDSKAQYESHWVPDPGDRLIWSMLLTSRNAWLLRASTILLPLFAAVLVTFLAFVTALAISGSSFSNDWMRFLGLLPLVLGGLSLLVLLQSRRQRTEQIGIAWQAFLIQVKRKLPVYNQAAETAALLKAFVHYDQQMTKAANKLSDRVDALASGELTEAITGAVKYVMAATVAPPIQKSADSLNLLAVQMEKKLTTGENQLVRLYTELEARQKNQAELWIKRYQEMGQTLTMQQKQSMHELVSSSQGNWQQLNESLSSLMHDLSSGQKNLQTSLLQDQQQSLEAIRQESLSVINRMQEQYVTTLSDQGQYQISALDEIQKQVLSFVQLANETTLHLANDLKTSQEQTLTRLCDNQSSMLATMDTHQTESLSALTTFSQNAISQLTGSQTETLEAMRQHQDLALAEISGKQSQTLEAIVAQQTTTLTELRDQQAAMLAELSAGSQGSLERISTAQEASLNALFARNEELLSAMRDQQAALLSEISASSQGSLASISENQAASLQLMSTRQEEILSTIRDQQAALLSEISASSQGSLASIIENQAASLQMLNDRQEEILVSMREQQAAMLAEISGTQATALDTISSRQAEALDGFLTRQAASLDAIQQGQQTALDSIAARLDGGLGQMASSQQAALDVFNSQQLEAVTELARQQQSSARDLLDHFSDQVAGLLSDHLSPVTTRLSESADALINAQAFARDVEKTLALQREQSISLEESVRNVLEQFVSTRQAMIDDLSSLAGSTRVISESAASMQSIYAGSQTGLSEAISHMSTDMVSLSDTLQGILKGSAEQTRALQSQAQESYEINQQHLDAVRSQIDILTNDLSNRIDQLMIGFSQLTEDLIHNVQNTIDNQNDQLGSGLKALTGVMADEARSISLYAQQINMDIDQLSSSLGESVTSFAKGVQLELSGVLSRLDEETADILRRLSVAASELGDAVEVLPNVIRTRGSGEEERPRR